MGNTGDSSSTAMITPYGTVPLQGHASQQNNVVSAATTSRDIMHGSNVVHQ